MININAHAQATMEHRKHVSELCSEISPNTALHRIFKDGMFGIFVPYVSSPPAIENY